MAILETLITFGDYLEVTNSFNRYDKERWPKAKVSGKSNLIASILRKYSRPLVGHFGMEIKSVFDEFSDQPYCKPNCNPKTGDVLFKPNYIPQGRFDQYKEIQKAFKLRWNPEFKSWFVPYKYLAWFNFDDYANEMFKCGIAVSAMPAIQVGSVARDPSSLVGVMSSFVDVKEPTYGPPPIYGNKVIVKRLPDGRFEFRMGYNPKLNELFSNQTGMLTGITEYNPSTKGRETKQITLVIEAIDKIKKILPDWKIETHGIDEALKEHEDYKERLNQQIPEVQAEIATGFALFPYQNEGVHFFDRTNGNALLGDEVGCGKTIQVLAWLVKNKKRALVVCPKVVRKTWLREAQKFFPRYFTEFNTIELSPLQIKKHGMPELSKMNLATVNYESLSKFFEAIEISGFDLLAVDECFHPETLVQTKNGEKAISKIIPGDYVKNCLGFSKVIATHRNKVSRWVKVSYNSRKIICSPNHLFFTSNGWIPAEKLKKGDMLASNNKTMQIVQQKIHKINVSEYLPSIHFLFSELQREMEYNQIQEIQELYSKQQPNAKGIYKKEGIRNIKSHGTQAFATWWKWMRPYKTRKIIDARIKKERQKMEVSMAGFSWEKMESKIPNLLQVRLDFARIKDWYRSGWVQPFCRVSEKTRPQKNEDDGFFRVDGVEVQEQRGLNGERESYFYDLSVEGHPSYSVNSVLVHNCHMIKNQKTLNCKNINHIAPLFKHKILMSGTAVKNKKHELFAQAEIIKPGLFESKEDLRKMTIGAAWNRLQDIYLARSKSQVLKQLPEKITQIIELDVEDCPDYDPAQGLKIEDCSRLKAEVAVAKSDATVEFVKELLEEDDSNAGVLVFSDSKEAAIKIHEILGKDISLLHHGEMSDQKREEIKDTFQKGHTSHRVLVTTRQSLAVGATLTRADKVVFSNLPWTASDVIQGEGRAYRIGSSKVVFVYWIVAADNNFDKKVSDLIRKKYELCKKMNEGKQLTAEERQWMNSVIRIEDFKKDSQ